MIWRNSVILIELTYTTMKQKTTFGPFEPFVHCHDDTYNRMDKPGRCGVCGKPTHYKSLYSAEFCCSIECSNELWCEISEKVATTSTRKKNSHGKRK